MTTRWTKESPVHARFSEPPIEGASRPETLPELELATRVLQGVSAIYLLLKASRSPQLEELRAAALRVRGWMSELDDTVLSGPASTRMQMLPVSLALGRAVGEICRLSFPHAGTDLVQTTDATARHISHSAQLIERVQAARELRTEFISSCCAADVQHISESRNH